MHHKSILYKEPIYNIAVVKLIPQCILSVNCTSPVEVSVFVRYGALSVDDWCQSFSDSVVVSSSVEVTLEDKTTLSLIFIYFTWCRASIVQWRGAYPRRTETSIAPLRKAVVRCSTAFTNLTPQPLSLCPITLRIIRTYLSKHYCCYVSLQWGI